MATNTPPWGYKGFARPDDTLSTMVWAMEQGRMDLLLSSATPEAQAQLCGLAGYETALTAAQLKTLHKDPKTYRAKVAKRLDELTKQGWSLPVYRDLILADAAAVSF